MLELSATEKVLVTAKAVDSEGNPVDDLGELVLTIENAVGNFGEFTGNEFNPGEAGATGTIVGTLGDLTASVDVMLVHGAPASLELSFTPEA